MGVRHHSPACARLVAATIERERPRFVLVEGPADMNDRLDELALPHALPIAIYSYLTRRVGEGSSGKTLASRATWCPFCDYSPEWVALHAARSTGATPLFIDLPAWHDAFWEVRNRYSDRHARTNDAAAALAAKLGVDDTDALWDHLFEQPCEPSVLAERLAPYFRALRDGDPPGARDVAREAYMRRWIGWARAQGDVVVVCGGYHAPELERPYDEDVPAERPTLPDADGHAGSYLVPYSFRRLDSFVGYDAGMPSPHYHQAVWERGHASAAEEMLTQSIARLRARKQRVSASDAIAASTTAHALQAMRGHDAIARVDLLDGLAAALVKEALDAPVPWSRRGTLARGTDPMLVEIVAAFSGERVGALAEGTPRPPLVDDAFAELARVGVTLSKVSTTCAPRLDEPAGRETSRVLHRLRVLGIAGIRWERPVSLERGARADLREGWRVERTIDLEPALIEAAAFGSTLEAAALGKLEELLSNDADLGELATRLHDAGRIGALEAGSLGARVLEEVRAKIWHEPSLAVVGRVIAATLGLYRYDALLGAKGAAPLTHVLAGAFDRALWLIEGARDPRLAVSREDLGAVVALRDLVRFAAGDSAIVIEPLRADAVMARRATDDATPPTLRGAALGFRWSTGTLGAEETAEAHALTAVRRAARTTTIGDFLAGLFALAREEVAGAHREGSVQGKAGALLRAIDELLGGLGDDDFLLAVPSLRLAFSWFPPLEKESIAHAVAALHGAADARALLHLELPAEAVLRGAQIDARATALAKKLALDDEGDA